MDPTTQQKWIDRLIQEAMAAGHFDDLPGTGQPIDWEDESLVDPEWAMAFRLLREQGFAPQWIELHKEIGRELEKARQAVLRSWRWRQEQLVGAREGERRYVDAEWARARAAFAETLAELNKKIVDFNLLVPVVRMQKFKLNLAKELAALGIEG